MGGKQSSEITKTEITNSINTQITNLTKNVTDILNETITNSTMNVVNENAQNILNSTSGGNTLQLGNVVSDGTWSEFNVNQTVDITSTNQAVANMMQDISAMSNLATRINASIINKIQNDSTMKQAMDAAAKLQNSTSTVGGMNDMVANVTKMIGEVLTPGTTMNTEYETKITNNIMSKIPNTTINKNTVKALVNNNIRQINIDSCTNNINTIIAGDVNVMRGGKVILNQIASVKSLSNCILDAAQTTALAIAITSGSSVSGKSDKTNKNAVTQSQDTNTDISKSTTSGDTFEEIISSISPSAMFGSIDGIACILIVLMIVLLMMKYCGIN